MTHLGQSNSNKLFSEMTAAAPLFSEVLQHNLQYSSGPKVSSCLIGTSASSRQKHRYFACETHSEAACGTKSGANSNEARTHFWVGRVYAVCSLHMRTGKRTTLHPNVDGPAIHHVAQTVLFRQLQERIR